MLRRTGIFFTILFAFYATAKGSQDVALAWDPSADPIVAGYVIYYGTNSGSYPFRFDAGGNTSTAIPSLTEGVTYYFVVAAYDQQGNESNPSNEVAYVVPGVLFLIPGTYPGDPVRIIFPVAFPHWYEVQATTDLQFWTTIWQTDPVFYNGWLEFVDFEAPFHALRFYRLAIH